MASSQEENNTPANPSPSVEDEIREDLWLYSGGRFGKNARWFVLSTIAHILVLSVFATTAVTIVQKRQELIKVKTLPLSAEDLQRAQAEEQVPDDWEGEPSLRDLPGLLTMEELAPRKTSTPAGPPPAVGKIRAVRAAALPVVSGFGPVTIEVGSSSRQVDGLSTQITNLSGAIGGLGGGFGDYVGGLRKVGLDVAIVVDATDSMQFVIDSVKSRLIKLVTALRQMVPTSRIGIVAYRDKGEEYVTKWTDLSFSTSKLHGFLSNLYADGGGDWPEALYQGLDVAIHDLRWRKKSRRIIVIVPGSPPHPESVSRILRLSQDFHAQGGVISVLDLAEKMHEDFERALWRHSARLTNIEFKPSPLPSFYKEFRTTMASVAQAGGGDFIPLTEEKALTKQIIVLTFGSRWRTEMARYLRDLE